MKINVVDTNGKEIGRQVDLPDSLFGIEPNEHVMYLAVKQYLANQRQGTHSARERGEIRGSTRKIKRQKGTGTARAGSIKNPLFRKGGRVFGPRPRSYELKLNKKVKNLARASALSAKAKSDAIVVLEDFSFDKPKTKEYVNVLRNLGVEGKKVLHLIGEPDKVLFLSSRNIQRTNLKEVRQLNTYEILNSDKLVFFESAIE
ncbi:MAG TPA: 50S ribosomal protein L4, partial [Bacteroidetes bacterium]|nr:50S ribosomal protein L4 [Bacteroidota bacterium]